MGWFSDLTGLKTPQLVQDAGQALYDTNAMGLTNDMNRVVAGQQPIGAPGQAVANNLGVGSDSAGGNVHTITQEPWSAIRPSLIGGIQNLNTLTMNPDGTMKQPVTSDATRAAMDRMGAESQFLPQAQGFYSNLMDGQSNPYLDATFGKAADAVRSKLDSQFAAAGRYGSGDQAREVGQAYNDLATNIYGGAYESDMGRRMQGLGLAPSLNAAQYADANRQFEAGSMADNFDYNQAMDRLNQYVGSLNAIGGNYGSQSQPIYENKTANIAALLAGGGSLLGALGAL